MPREEEEKEKENENDELHLLQEVLNRIEDLLLDDIIPCEQNNRGAAAEEGLVAGPLLVAPWRFPEGVSAFRYDLGNRALRVAEGIVLHVAALARVGR